MKKLHALIFALFLVMTNFWAKSYLDSRLAAPLWIGKFDYLTSEFVQSTKGVQWIDYRGYMVPVDHDSAYFNFSNGMRHTVGQPTHPVHTIWIFGSSSLYGHLVKDEQTIASELQSLLPNYHVNNMGSIKATAQQETLRLADSNINAGDIVIFYDGPVDAFTVYNRAAEQSPNVFCDRLSQIALIGLSCELTRPFVMNDSKWVNQEIDNMLWRYRSAIFEAKYITLMHGAKFYHFLQPTLFSRGPIGRENSISNSYREGQAGLHDAYKLSWPVVQAFARSTGSFDLTHLLDNDESFFDILHTMPNANKQIAKAIATSIWSEF